MGGFLDPLTSTLISSVVGSAISNSIKAPTTMIPTNVTNADNLNDSAVALDELAQLHATRLSILGNIATGTGGTETLPVDPTPITKKPWIDPPDGFVPFDQQQTATLPNVGNTVTVVSIVVPDGMDGVIKAIEWNFTGGGFVQGSGDLVAQIQRNGVAVRNFENILVEKGTVNIPREVSPIRIYSNQTVSIVVTHAANPVLNGNLIGTLWGYFYPSKG